MLSDQDVKMPDYRRISTNEYFLRIAFDASLRGTCRRRRVGCVLVDEHKHVMSTGYNGVPSGMIHCLIEPCPGALALPGRDLDKCMAIHAEQNALLQCSDVNRIIAAYCTDSPCIHCVKLLLNTSCKVIVFARAYPHPDSQQLWERAGRVWHQYEEQFEVIDYGA